MVVGRGDRECQARMIRGEELSKGWVGVGGGGQTSGKSLTKVRMLISR